MDRVKKLKVKESDGSFSDYIPIGVDAKYVDLKNGNMLEDELNQKIYYFNTIAEMKDSSNKLKDKDVVQTLGYYSINDGGKATYRIRTKKSEDVDNGGSVLLLKNNLIAELIIENNTINVKQFGAYGDDSHNDTNSIQNAVDFAVKTGIENLYIPSGTFLISTIKVTNKIGFARIHIFGNNIKKLSVLKSISNNNISTGILDLSNCPESIIEKINIERK